MSEQLDLMPLANACRRLAEGLARYQRDLSDVQIRDGLVQRFEFTYEISVRMLKRHLERVAASPAEFDDLAFPDLVRTASEQGLLKGEWKDWKGYRDMRSRTSHSYDESIALGVVAGIPVFLAEAEYLLDRLRERNA